MENNLLSVIGILIAIIVILVGVLAFSYLYIAEDKAQDAAEAQEQKLNTQFQRGIDIGYQQGMSDIVKDMINKIGVTGMINVLENYTLYNAVGCGLQAGAELQARGCQIVCPEGGG